ncbi:MAG TPA: radical SAM protein [Methanophagales archaeon]|nr:radical SAM protein [Methanophagales archaeon]
MKKYDPTASITDIVDSNVFGAVTSRRGGQSLGINILPLGKKSCSFDCAYCMLGRTQSHSGKGAGASVDLVEGGLIEASEFLKKIKRRIDSIALTGNGEPTLNPKFSDIVERILEVRDDLFSGVPVVIYTNSSKVCDKSVMRGLAMADIVIAKLDAIDEELRELINHPSNTPPVKDIVAGLRALRNCINGKLAVDIMLVEIAEETNLDCLDDFSEALLEIRPPCVYVQTPTKPPVKTSVKSVAKEELIKSARVIKEKTGYDVYALLGMNPPMPIAVLATWTG